MSISTKKNEKLRDELRSTTLTPKFVEKRIVGKQKAFEGLPITYNPHLIQNELKDQSSQNLHDHYEKFSAFSADIKTYCGALGKVKNKLDSLHSTQKQDFEKHQKDIIRLNNKITRYEENKAGLEIKRDLLKAMNEQIQITTEDEEVLFERDIQDASQGTSEDYEKMVLESLKKLDSIKELAAILQQDEQHSTGLADSLNE